MIVYYLWNLLASLFTQRFGSLSTLGGGILVIIVMLMGVSILLSAVGVNIDVTTIATSFFGRVLRTFGQLSLFILRLIPRVCRVVYRHVRGWFSGTNLSPAWVNVLTVVVTAIILVII